MAEVATGQIRIDADVTNAVNQLKNLDKQLNRLDNLGNAFNKLIPGGTTMAQITSRISGGFLQLVQGMSRNIFQTVTSGAREFVSAGVDVATTLESSAKAFENLLGTEEEANKLLLDIQKNAISTPFDVDGLVMGTQKLTLITKNGVQAENTILDLGKALTAAGRGSAELTRMATNLQQIGTNSKITARDIREFGNAGINVIELVSEYTGKSLNETEEWLKGISNPYEVITGALHAAATESGKFADIYEKNAMTIGQVTENIQDAISVFSYQLIEQSKAIDVAKSSFQKITNLFTDQTFLANSVAAVQKLVDVIDDLNIINPIIQKIKDFVSAFAAGQFDNVIVFFQTLWNTIKQFSGFRVIGNAIKVVLDLFSDNHTAEEVKKIATEIGNLIVTILEFKMCLKVANYVQNLTQSVMTMYNGFQIVARALPGIVGQLGGLGGAFGKVTLAIGLVVSAIAVFSNLTDGGVTDILDSIKSGIENFVKGIGNVVKDFTTAGFNLMAGLWNGIVDGAKGVISGIKDVANAIMTAFKSALGIHSPSTRMRDEVGQYIDLGIAEGIRVYYKDIASATEEVMEEMVKLQADYVNEMGEYGALDLVQQANAYKKFADLYAKGTRARLEMDEKVHAAESAITKQIIELVEEYNKQFNKAMVAAKDYYGMFDYTQSIIARSTKSVIEGLKRQNDNLNQYYTNLKKMSEMGFDSDFMQYVYDQGLDAASEVAGLADATQEQIEEINKLWQTRGKLATDIAVLNTKELKEETLEEIDYLQEGLDTKVVDVYDTGTLLGYNFTRGIYDMLPTIEDAIERVKVTTSKASKSSGDSGLSDAFDVDTSGLEAAIGDIDEATASLGKLNLEAFDTNDIFSLMRNLLSGMPWYVWAGAGLAAIGGLLKGVSGFNTALRGTGTVLKSGKGALDTVTTTVTSFITQTSDKSQKLGQTVSATTNGISKSVKATQNDIEKTVTETTKTTTKAAKKVNDITYDSSTKVGENILKPFKTFNTKVKGFTSSIVNTINSFVDMVIEPIKHLLDEVTSLLTKAIGDIGKIINKAISTFFSSINEVAKGITKVVKTVARGIGEALAAMLEPLSNPQLLIGAGIILALSAAILLLTEAIKESINVIIKIIEAVNLFVAALVEMSNTITGLNVGGLAELLAVISVVSTIMTAVLPMAAMGAVAGAFATMMSVELVAIAGGLMLASQAASNINMQGILNLSGAVTITSLLLATLLPIAALGAIAGIAASIMSTELLIIAGGMAGASVLSQAINLGALTNLSAAIVVVSTVLASTVVSSIVGAVAGMFASVMSVEFLIIAGALAAASALSDHIDIKKLENIAEANRTVGDILTSSFWGSIVGSIVGAVATVMSVEFLAIAAALAAATALSGHVDVEKLKNIANANQTVGDMLTGSMIGTILGANIGGFAAIMSTEVLIIARALSEASEIGGSINLDTIGHIGDAIKKMNEIDFGGFFEAYGDASKSAAVAATAQNIETIVAYISSACWKLNEINKIDENLLANSMSNMGAIVVTLQLMPYKDFDKLVSDAKNIDKLSEVSQSIETIVAYVSSACWKLYEIEQIDKDALGRYMTDMVDIIGVLQNITYGEYKDLKSKNKTSDTLSEISTNISEIIIKVSEAVEKLSELEAKAGRGRIDGYVEQARKIVEALGQFELKDEGGGLFSSSQKETTKKASELVKDIAGSIDEIISSTKNIVDNLAALSDKGIDPAKVEQYVEDAKTVMNQFANISPDGNVSEDCKNNVSNIAGVADSVDKILSSAKGVVENVKYFEDDVDGVEKVTELVANANQIVAEFGKLALKNETQDAYANLSKNSSDLASAVGNVSNILKNAKSMFDALKQYQAAMSKDNAIIAVQDINAVLACIAGGTAYHNGGDEWFQGIKMPDDSGFSGADVTSLENVKKALDQVKEIANLAQSVPDVSEYLTHIDAIIKFIQDSMAQLPDKIGAFAEDFKNIGENTANYFKQGWESKYGEIEQAGRDMQNALWTAIENKMNDEYEQGRYMAENFVNGLKSRNNDITSAGNEIQGTLWSAIESKMNDEYEQGRYMAKQIHEGLLSHDFYGSGISVQGAIWRGIQDRIPDMQSQGHWIGEQEAIGVANGISDNLWRIERASARLSQTSINKIRDILQIASPSKVMAEMGGYVAEGFASGIEDGLSEVESAGEKLAEAVMGGYDSAIEPLSASAMEARAWNQQQEMTGAGLSRGGVTINQYNDIHDQMDMSKALNDLSWQVARA